MGKVGGVVRWQGDNVRKVGEWEVLGFTLEWGTHDESKISYNMFLILIKGKKGRWAQDFLAWP